MTAPNGAYRPVTTTSGLAIAALVSVFFIGLLGLILGYVAQSDIRNSNGTKTGSGLATAAIVIGWVSIPLGILWMILYFAFLSSVVSTYPY